MTVADARSVEATPNGRSGLVRDAAITIATRFGLAILIFATDIILARALGPSAKGRFALVLLYSQLAATIVGFGMDQAIAVVARPRPARGPAGGQRTPSSGRRSSAASRSARIALAVRHSRGRPAGRSARGAHPEPLRPPSSPSRRLRSRRARCSTSGCSRCWDGGRSPPTAAIRLLRRLTLLALLVGDRARHRARPGGGPGPEPRLARRDARGDRLGREPGWAPRRAAVRRRSSARSSGSADGRSSARSPSGSSSAPTCSSSTRSSGVRATGIYSVTSGLAETLWYIPNALGVVMFSRAVDPTADAGRTAAVLTRTTLAMTLVLAIPAALLGPRFVRLVYGPQLRRRGRRASAHHSGCRRVQRRRDPVALPDGSRTTGHGDA